jgi:hypothetical protein
MCTYVRKYASCIVSVCLYVCMYIRMYVIVGWYVLAGNKKAYNLLLLEVVLEVEFVDLRLPPESASPATAGRCVSICTFVLASICTLVLAKQLRMCIACNSCALWCCSRAIKYVAIRQHSSASVSMQHTSASSALLVSCIKHVTYHFTSHTHTHTHTRHRHRQGGDRASFIL